ncbi:MAG TPA: calcium/sodium antiporter [Saprospiraceae bacterium]|nr:calcium/sodium antiporter [Saprospiraceae bacterium]HMP23534.1 calcium/sodium antiporter [Saprospiraceae bacterium]
MTILLLLAGFILLIIGAEALVRGASKIAAAVGIPSLIIGLTVVAFGTSAPELAVSIMSSFSGKVDIAVGNVVGSNIFNVLFLLGLTALIVPLVVARQLIRFDVPLLILFSFLFLILGLDGKISRSDGLLLFLLLVAYNAFLIYQSRKGQSLLVETQLRLEYNSSRQNRWRLWAVNLLLVGIGLAMLVLGSRWLVQSATQIAQKMGVSDLIIGLTVVAAGTSLPEVATSIIASLRGERDIAVGNAIGSSIFNILAVLGIASLVSPNGLPVSKAALQFDIPIMIAAAIACLPIFFTGHRIVRWEGAVFLGYYIAYTTYLILAATEHSALAVFDTAMVWFVMPLTVLTLVLTVLRSFKTGNPSPE